MVFMENYSNLTGEEIEEIAVKAIALTEMVLYNDWYYSAYM